MLAPTLNDEFELPDGSYSVSDSQEYFEYIFENMKHLLIISQYKYILTELKTELHLKLRLDVF